MINLSFNSAYQYTPAEKGVIKSLKKKYGKKFQKSFGKSNKMVWYDGQVKVIAIKHEISKKVLWESRFRCSFCGKRLEASSKPIDHFIPNKKYPQYSFHPLNLLSSCSYCNSDSKGEFDPIVTAHKKYTKIVFSIVHPIVDNVVNEFRFQADGVNFDLPNCSSKAKKLIDMFNWTSLEHQLSRSAQLTIELFHPISDADLLTLVNECATYKPKK